MQYSMQIIGITYVWSDQTLVSYITMIIVIIDVLSLATINHLSVLYTYMLVYRSLFCITIK